MSLRFTTRACLIRDLVTSIPACPSVTSNAGAGKSRNPTRAVTDDVDAETHVR